MLERLMERKERYDLLLWRNQVIISLLIYQGLTTGELLRLRTVDIELVAGLIRVPATNRTKGRTLELRARQVMLMADYLALDRPRLLRAETGALLLTLSGRPETGEGIGYLFETSRHLFPGRRVTATVVRQSVIAGLLAEGRDLRVVQVFDGQKYPSTTERYRQTGTKELQAAIAEHHPLR